MNPKLICTHWHGLALLLCLALTSGLIWGSTLGNLARRASSALHFNTTPKTAAARTPAQPAATDMATALTPAAPAQAGGAYNVVKSVIAGGGERSTGGAYQLNGTLGQSFSGEASGGAYALSGGFWAGGSSTMPNAVASVSAASFAPGSVASESIVAAFGVKLATRVETAATVPLPTTLAGTTVRIRDSFGTERLAPLFFVATDQINYQIPLGVSQGSATVTVTSGDGTLSTGTLQIARVAPGLFAANSNGQGVPAALALRVKTDGAQVYELVASYDAGQQRYVPLPLDLGPAGEELYLILYGTGARNFSNLANVLAQVGGTSAGVTYVGAVEGLVGLDQLNVGPLPRSLAGRGVVNIAVQVDGQAANVVTVSLR